MSRVVVQNRCSLTMISAGFEDLDLTDDTVDEDGNYFLIEACDEGTTWGAPVPVDTAVERWKTDGAIAETQGYDNRQIAFNVIISADTPDALDAGEHALARRMGRACLLRWTPTQGEDDATSTDFEVWTWNFTHAFSSIDERHTQRMYAITMTAKPYARSTELVVDAALPLPGSPTTTEVDTCASTSGWAGAPTAVTTSGGAVKVTVTVPPTNYGRVAAHLTRTGPISGLDATPILALDLAVSNAQTSTWGDTTVWSVSADGVPLTKVGQVGSVQYWKVPAGTASLSVLKIDASITPTSTATTVTMSIADVSKTDTVGGIGSRKQLTRSLDVVGSVPTSGSIKIASPNSTGLKTVLLYTGADNGLGFNPGLRQYRTLGNAPSAQADAVSGYRESLTAGPITCTIPANVVPEATYAVVARVYASAATTTTITGSIGTGSATQAGALGATVSWAGAGYQWVVLGSVDFPLLAMPAESLVSSSVVLQASGGTGVALDECYLLDITHGECSAVDCGSTNTRLWFDAADVAINQGPRIYVGTQDNRSDADAAQNILWKMEHRLRPGGTVIFTVVEGVDNAAVSASYYPRGHTHAPAAA